MMDPPWIPTDLQRPTFAPWTHSHGPARLSMIPAPSSHHMYHSNRPSQLRWIPWSTSHSFLEVEKRFGQFCGSVHKQRGNAATFSDLFLPPEFCTQTLHNCWPLSIFLDWWQGKMVCGMQSCALVVLWPARGDRVFRQSSFRGRYFGCIL
jgi:hypothetical protein